MLESFFRSMIGRLMIGYFAALVILTYLAKWIDSNGEYIAMGLTLAIIGLVVSVVALIAFRYFRRW